MVSIAASALAIAVSLTTTAHAQGIVFSEESLSSSGAVRPPEYYTVQTGDTLWEISSKFLGNPYYWPRLWSINEHITNPHWIYPGNKIRFTLGTLIEPPEVALESLGPSREGFIVETSRYVVSEAVCGPDVRFQGAIAAHRYAAPGFLAFKEDVDIYGTIGKARERKELLSERDLVYLKVDDPKAFDCGDVLMVFRPVQKNTKHPENRRKKLGNVYRILGEAVVVHRSEGYVAAWIRKSWAEVRRGDLVGPMIPIAVEVEVREPSGELRGAIIGRVGAESMLAANGETVFLDLGRAQGVRVGSTFYVVERRDEAVDRKKEDPALPESVIGRVVVVRVDQDQCTAVVVDSARPIGSGNHITTVVD